MAQERVSEIVHGAASVSFGNDLSTARATNLEGTRRVLEFAERSQARGGLRRFTYISTAFVASLRSYPWGEVPEDAIDLG